MGRQAVEVAEGTLRVQTGDGKLRREMEGERRVREERKARMEAGGAPAAVKGKCTPVPPRVKGMPWADSTRLAAISARQMAKHRRGE